MMSDFKDLLLQDYKYRVEAMAKSEAAGETRVNLFITLITISSGAIGALLTKGGFSAAELSMIAAVAFFSLLLVGLVTFMRMIVRNVNTDQCKAQLDLIRRTYQDQLDFDGTWVPYELFPRGPKRKDEKQALGENAQDSAGIQARQFGGLPHTVAVLNSLLCAGLSAALLAALFGPVSEDCVPLLLAVALLVIAATFTGHIVYLKYREKETKDKMERDFPRDSHAGGVIYQSEGDKTLYLLVSAKKGGPIKFLPKGHIKPGEGHAEAALREVCEETGIVARVCGFVGRARLEIPDKDEKDQSEIPVGGKKEQVKLPLNDKKKQTELVDEKKTVSVKFFLMEYLCMTLKDDDEEDRSQEWVAYEEALRRLPRDTRSILRKAEQLRLWKSHPAKAPAAAIATGSGTSATP